ncbi:MAG: hypothetical protein WC473_05175 [Patescibacteria group bacterium]
MKTPKDKKRIPLGDLLREKTATSRSRLEKEAKEKQRLREKPFVDWAKSLIKELPRILKAIADEGGTEYSESIEIAKFGHEKQWRQPPTNKQLADFLEEAYTLWFWPIAGRMLENFCEQNDLVFRSNWKLNDLITITIHWEEKSA